MSAERLAAALDNARHVTFDPSGAVLAWFGSHGVHVFDLAGSEIDYFTVGDFSVHEADYREVVAAARAYLCEEE